MLSINNLNLLSTFNLSNEGVLMAVVAFLTDITIGKIAELKYGFLKSGK